MNSENITRVEISPELHEDLKNQVNIQKEQGYKNITLRKVLDELCTIGLNYQKLSKERSFANTETQTGLLSPNPSLREFNIEDKSETKLMIEATRTKEIHLHSKEKMILHKENQVFNRWEKAIELKEQALKITENQEGLKSRVFYLQQENKALRHEIEKFQNKQSNFANERFDELSRTLQSIKRNTKPKPRQFIDQLKEDILPLINTGLLGSLAIDNKKNENKSNPQIDSNFLEILRYYSEIPEDKRSTIHKEITEVFKKFQSQSNPETG